jgi:hypothetical protein
MLMTKIQEQHLSKGVDYTDENCAIHALTFHQELLLQRETVHLAARGERTVKMRKFLEYTHVRVSVGSS